MENTICLYPKAEEKKSALTATEILIMQAVM